jgi:hypothetical protein
MTSQQNQDGPWRDAGPESQIENTPTISNDEQFDHLKTKALWSRELFKRQLTSSISSISLNSLLENQILTKTDGKLKKLA